MHDFVLNVVIFHYLLLLILCYANVFILSFYVSVYVESCQMIISYILFLAELGS